MKKYILLLVGLLSAPWLHAQGQLGIQGGPSAAYNSVYPTSSVGAKGVSTKFQAGVLYDRPVMKDNYYVSTGLFYSGQYFAMTTKQQGKNNTEEQHELHYIQIPVLLKLYTSEVALDVRLYGKIGGALQCKVSDMAEKVNKEGFRFLVLMGTLGAGIEWDTGFSTSVFGGISYSTGLSSVIDRQDRVHGYNKLFSIDVGVRF